jgi:hypothetical protein
MAGAIGLAVALLLVLWLAWICLRTARRMGWHADEQEAERFTADLRRFPPTELIPLTPWQSRVASVEFRSLRPTPAEYRELACECAETADRIEARHAAHLGDS